MVNIHFFRKILVMFLIILSRNYLKTAQLFFEQLMKYFLISKIFIYDFLILVLK